MSDIRRAGSSRHVNVCDDGGIRAIGIVAVDLPTMCLENETISLVFLSLERCKDGRVNCWYRHVRPNTLGCKQERIHDSVAKVGVSVTRNNVELMDVAVESNVFDCASRESPVNDGHSAVRIVCCHASFNIYQRGNRSVRRECHHCVQSRWIPLLQLAILCLSRS